MKTLRIFFFLLPFIISGGCTHNNGNIGELFGQWIMTDITADGVRPTELTPSDWNWRFQSGVLLISHVDQAAHSHQEFWASWQREGQTLVVNYKNTDPAIDYNYQYPAELGFSKAAVYDVDIVASSGKQMTLRMLNPEGVTYVYTLKKN